MRKQFYQTELGKCYVWNYQNADCSLRNKFIVLFIIIFGKLSFPIASLIVITVTVRLLSSPFAARVRLLLCWPRRTAVSVSVCLPVCPVGHILKVTRQGQHRCGQSTYRRFGQSAAKLVRFVKMRWKFCDIVYRNYLTYWLVWIRRRHRLPYIGQDFDMNWIPTFKFWDVFRKE